MEGGQKKIVVKVEDEAQLVATLKKADQMKLNNCYIRDAGLTQVNILLYRLLVVR
jgi:peptidyl-tRNA hydrolase